MIRWTQTKRSPSSRLVREILLPCVWVLPEVRMARAVGTAGTNSRALSR